MSSPTLPDHDAAQPDASSEATRPPVAASEMGLIGLGLLGSALAERLLEAGFQLYGYDTDQAAISRFEALGGCGVARLNDLTSKANPVLLCLPDSHIVSSVLHCLVPELSGNCTIIDLTTGDPRTTMQLAAELAAAGHTLLDAPVLGSSQIVRDGQAVLMVGGPANSFQQWQPVWNAISASVFHTGDVGSGQQMKLVANLVLGLNRAALAEGLHLASICGLNLPAVLDVLKSGASYSRAMDAKGTRMIERNFQPQARLSQHLKDVRLILQQAQTANTRLPLSETHQQLLTEAEARGFGAMDNSAIIQAYE